MLDGRRVGKLAILLGLGFAAVAGAIGAERAARSSAGEPADLKTASGYLERDGSPTCYGGTHQLSDSCSGVAVPLQSSTLDLDAFLCRYLEVTGEANNADNVINAGGLRVTANRCPVDCDADGLHDSCAIRHRLIPDCNGNDAPDLCDIQGGASVDCNQDGVPDECQVAPCELDDGVIMMSVSEPGRVSWHPERGYSSFNVYSGGLSWIGGQGASVDRGKGSAEEDGDTGETEPGASPEPGVSPAAPDLMIGQGCDLEAVSLWDDITPARGEAIYYLVTGNRHGAEHDASIDANGARRVNSIPCPAPVGPLDVSVRTDKTIYAPGETVHIEVYLANLNPTGEIVLLFATPCKVTFEIEDLNGTTVYLDLYHNGCSYQDDLLTLSPGQIASYEFAWDQTDDRGRPVLRIANYVVRGMVLHRDPVPSGITGISIRR